MSRGSVLGLSATTMGAILAACGNANSSSSSSGAAGASAGSSGKAGGTLKLAQQTPAASMNPLTVADAGGLNLLAQTGEYLVFDSNATLKLEPMLATLWSPNHDGSIWTFHLRPGVRFHTGQLMSADDVVWTFQQLSNTKNASNALSNFADVLTPSGVRKVDAQTVAFHLDGPNGNFPYLVSSDNYNAIIVPKGTDYAKWQSTFVGTGPFKLKSYTQNVGASFVPNPDYWGTKPLLSATTFNFYQSQQPQILAVQGGDVDAIVGIVPTGAEALLNSSQYSIISRRSAGHREISMRTDLAPFNDPRVRRALALTLDRPAIVKGLLSGRGSVGNDSPFGPRFPSTDTSVPQRAQDLAQAKQLLAAAGRPSQRDQGGLHLRDDPGDASPGAGHPGSSPQGRDRLHAEDRGPERLLRQEHVRQLRLAGRDGLGGRLRRPRRPQHLSGGASDLARGLERRSLQGPHLRPPGEAVRRQRRPSGPARGSGQDRAPAPGADAGPHPVLPGVADTN